MDIFQKNSSLFKGIQHAKEKGIAFGQTLTKLIPFLIGFLFGTLWITNSPQTYENHPYLFLTGLNFLFSFLVVSNSLFLFSFLGLYLV